jgi:hypothetical protein
VRCWQEIVGKRDAERLAAVVDELLVKGATKPLGEAADQLALDHHRVDRTADVVTDQEALDCRFSGIGVDPHDANMDVAAIRCSRRSSIHLTGRPNRNAAKQTRKSSG